MLHIFEKVMSDILKKRVMLDIFKKVMPDI